MSTRRSLNCSQLRRFFSILTDDETHLDRDPHDPMNFMSPYAHVRHTHTCHLTDTTRLLGLVLFISMDLGYANTLRANPNILRRV